jgi:hypothetical protein
VRQWDWPVVWPDPQRPGPGSSMTMLPKEKEEQVSYIFIFHESCNQFLK